MLPIAQGKQQATTALALIRLTRKPLVVATTEKLRPHICQIALTAFVVFRGGGGDILRMIVKTLLAFLLCTPAFATPMQDMFRKQIMAGDIAGVDAILTEAILQDAEPGTDPELQRALFHVFWATDPKIEAFTANWLAKDPTSAHAMTARGWYLHAMGAANRGTDWARYTYPAGMEIMLALDTEALALFSAASKAEPGLLSASDGLLEQAKTVAPAETLPLELERIMALHPNRGSLLRAMFKLSPQWGGTADQVRLVCDRYAPMVTAIKDYTPDVCVVDAVYYGSFQNGPMREAASAALETLSNPVLDYARILDAFDGKGSADSRLSLLNKVKSERQLTAAEALIWENLNVIVTKITPAPPNDVPVYRKALSQGLQGLRQVADRDPFNPKAVIDYIQQLEQNYSVNGVAFDRADADQRLHRLLVAIPHSWRGWQRLAQLHYDREPGTIQKTAAYLQNAVAYSNYSVDALQEALIGMLIMTDGYSKRKATAGHLNQTPEDVAELDRLGRCPAVALTRLLEAVCKDRGIDSEVCFSAGYDSLLNGMLEDVQARGACQTEINASLGDLIKGPVPADF